MIDFGYDPQQAAEMPRWSSTQPGPGANWPHDCPDALNLEGTVPGTRSTPTSPAGVTRSSELGDLDGPCSVEIIRRDAATGMLLAGSDPRRDAAGRSPTDGPRRSGGRPGDPTVKLVIQIPSRNEEATLPATLAELPTRLPGF